MRRRRPAGGFERGRTIADTSPPRADGVMAALRNRGLRSVAGAEVAKTRQFILIQAPKGGEPAGATPMGTKREVARTLARFNTAPEGSGEGAGVAHGPGMRLELPMVGDRDEVSQLLVTVIEEELAWPVLARVCREQNWRLMDPDTGRMFGG